MLLVATFIRSCDQRKRNSVSYVFFLISLIIFLGKVNLTQKRNSRFLAFQKRRGCLKAFPHWFWLINVPFQRASLIYIHSISVCCLYFSQKKRFHEILLTYWTRRSHVLILRCLINGRWISNRISPVKWQRNENRRRPRKSIEILESQDYTHVPSPNAKDSIFKELLVKCHH